MKRNLLIKGPIFYMGTVDLYVTTGYVYVESIPQSRISSLNDFRPLYLLLFCFGLNALILI